MNKTYSQELQSQKKNDDQEQVESSGNEVVAKVVNILKKNPILSLFHDETEEAFAQLQIEKGYRIVPVMSKNFSSFVRNWYFKNYKKSLSKDAMERIGREIESAALFENPRYRLFVRTANYDGAIWYDLGDSAVRIAGDGWTVVENPPILFRKFSVQRNQSHPILGGAIEKVFDFVNITKGNDRLLFLVVLIAAFIPDIPHPIVMVTGPQGAAKSSLFRALINIVDPAVTEDVHTKSESDFIQAAAHRWVVPLDNLDLISTDMSNLLCKMATGAGFAKRALYTNDDDVLRSYRRVLCLNGVNLPVVKPDIFDRGIIFKLERISPEARREESKIEKEFSLELPKLLGACFDILARAVPLFETVRLKKKPRMADFAVKGAAIAIALGYTAEQFIDAYELNILGHTQEALESSPLAITIRYYLDNIQPSIEGTPTNVWQHLSNNVTSAGEDPKYFPKTSKSFGHKLTELEPLLSRVGISVEREKGKERNLRIQKCCENVGNVETSPKVSRSRQSDDVDVSFQFGSNIAMNRDGTPMMPVFEDFK